MNRVKKFLFMVGLLIFVCLLQPITGISQVSDPGCDPLDPACPIDGGVSLLIAAGIGLGAKKAYDKKKKLAEI